MIDRFQSQAAEDTKTLVLQIATLESARCPTPPTNCEPHEAFTLQRRTGLPDSRSTCEISRTQEESFVSRARGILPRSFPGPLKSISTSCSVLIICNMSHRDRKSAMTPASARPLKYEIQQLLRSLVTVLLFLIPTGICRINDGAREEMEALRSHRSFQNKARCPFPRRTVRDAWKKSCYGEETEIESPCHGLA